MKIRKVQTEWSCSSQILLFYLGVQSLRGLLFCFEEKRKETLMSLLLLPPLIGLCADAIPNIKLSTSQIATNQRILLFVNFIRGPFNSRKKSNLFENEAILKNNPILHNPITWSQNISLPFPVLTSKFWFFYQSRERVYPNARVQRVETDVLKLCVSSNGVNITVQSLVCWWAPLLGPTQCWWAPYGPNTWYWVMSSSTTCGLMEPWPLTPYHLSSHCSISLYLHLVPCCS